MSEQRSTRAASSFLFKLAESFGTQGVAFVVSLVLARLLGPSDYGMLTMLNVFIALSQVFVQSGLNTALIQKKDVDECDLSSVFFVCVLIAAALYGLLFAFAPAIGAFYRMPRLAAVLRVLALILFPGAVVSVQNAVVARQMAFRKLMLASLCATIFSGVVGIGMAYAGLGVWALVGQQLANQCGLMLILFATVRWRPRALFSLKRVGVLISFGWKLLVSSLLETGYNQLRSLVIGRKFTAEALGFYNRGKQFPELVMNAVNGSIQSVMLPVLSEKQEDIPRMKWMMRRSVMASSYLVWPLMAGLAAVAPSLVSVLLGDAWLACVPFLQICCIDFAFYPVHTANLQAINALGRSDVFLKLELIKKSYGIVILAVTVLCFEGIMPIAWGAVLSTLLSAFVNAQPNKRLISYGYFEQMRDILPPIFMSVGMFGAVYAMNLLALPPFGLLCLQVLAGVAVYAALSLIFKPESFRFLTEMASSLLKRQGSKQQGS